MSRDQACFRCGAMRPEDGPCPVCRTPIVVPEGFLPRVAIRRDDLHWLQRLFTAARRLLQSRRDWHPSEGWGAENVRCWDALMEAVAGPPPDGALEWDFIEEEVSAWQKETFPNVNALSTIKHMMKEVNEVMDDIEAQAPRDKLIEEVVDLWFFLMQLRRAVYVSPADFKAAVLRKLEKNQRRKWQKPNADGVVEHVRCACGDPERPVLHGPSGCGEGSGYTEPIAGFLDEAVFGKGGKR